MAGFSNSTMRQPVKGKPHIALIQGWYRVSPETQPGKVRKITMAESELFHKAHKFVRPLNDKIHTSKTLIDRELLVKYMAKVIDCEGVNLLDSWSSSGIEFTDTELMRLSAIEHEARKMIK